MSNIIKKAIIGIDKSLDNIKKSADSASVNKSIKQLEEERNRELMALGRLVYDLNTSGVQTFEQGTEICNRITVYENRILQLMQSLSPIELLPDKCISENGILCSCGNINREDASFCSLCGIPLAANDTNEEDCIPHDESGTEEGANDNNYEM